MIMQDLKKFRAHLIVRKGIGDICADSYVNSIKRFFKATSLDEPGEDDIIDYLMEYHERGMSYSYVVNTMLGLEHYMEFLGKPIKLSRPRKPKRIIEDWLTEQEIARLFVYCKNTREKIIIALLAFTGIRNLELCRLRVKDIDFQAQTVFIKGGKGLKDGIVCIAPPSASIVAQYLKEYRRHPDQTLLFSIEGSRIGRPMLPGAIRKHVKTIAKRAGLEKRIYPHEFRNSLAMNMLLRGCDIYSIKEQLRHTFLSTTEIYIRSNPQIMRNNYQVFAPNYIWGNFDFMATPQFVFTGSNNYNFNRKGGHYGRL